MRRTHARTMPTKREADAVKECKELKAKNKKLKKEVAEFKKKEANPEYHENIRVSELEQEAKQADHRARAIAFEKHEAIKRAKAAELELAGVRDTLAHKEEAFANQAEELHELKQSCAGKDNGEELKRANTTIKDLEKKLAHYGPMQRDLASKNKQLEKTKQELNNKVKELDKTTQELDKTTQERDSYKNALGKKIHGEEM